MLNFARSAVRWTGRHAFPALAATVVAVGAAGGGIGYAVASQHTAVPAATSAATPSPASGPLKGGGAGATRAPGLLQRALQMLATQTGQSVAAVRSQLAAGKSIDEIAGSKAAAIQNEILAAITKVADRAVKRGRITPAQESADLAMARTRISALLAEPGTQLLKDAQNALRFLQGHGARPHPAPTAPASPAA
jgi:hypothetical protein